MFTRGRGHYKLWLISKKTEGSVPLFSFDYGSTSTHFSRILIPTDPQSLWTVYPWPIVPQPMAVYLFKAVRDPWLVDFFLLKLSN